MASRMDKYRSDSAKNIQSRSKKNEHLYEQLYTNKVYTEFTSIIDDNVVDLQKVSQAESSSRRERYQKDKILNSNSRYEHQTPSLNDNLIEDEADNNKNYDINNVLENAKKNRDIDSEFRQKNYLKTVEYNILSDLTMDKLKSVKEQKQKLTKEEEENLEDLINTITSNSLRKKIDDELLSNLMPSEDSETIISKELLEQLDTNSNITVNVDCDENNDTAENQIDKSFYTKSMDLSEEDFDQELEEEDKSFLESSKMSLSKKIVIIISIVLIVAIIGYVLYRFI